MKKLILLFAIIFVSCQKIEQPLQFNLIKAERTETGFTVIMQVPTGKLPVNVNFHAYNQLPFQALLDKSMIIDSREEIEYTFKHASFRPDARIYLYYSNEQTNGVNVIIL